MTTSVQDGLWLEDVPGAAPPELLLDPAEVARLSPAARRERVGMLIEHSHRLLDIALTDLVGDRHQAAGIVGPFSGGNDSHTLVHVMRERLTHLAHANTGIGIEETRDFVRRKAADYDLPLLERSPAAKDSYEAHVLRYGFPGPAMHFKMYTRLKERALEQVRNELVDGQPHRRRVVFLAGRRREESKRRANVPEFERKGSIVWCSPMVLWTKIDLNTYRQMVDLERNPVADLIHMSGECLCGAFAGKGELDEVGAWFPQVREHIADLARRALANGVPAEQCQWGWGAYRDDPALRVVGGRREKPRSGPLCDSCDARADETLFGDTLAV